MRSPGRVRAGALHFDNSSGRSLHTMGLGYLRFMLPTRPSPGVVCSIAQSAFRPSRRLRAIPKTWLLRLRLSSLGYVGRKAGARINCDAARNFFTSRTAIRLTKLGAWFRTRLINGRR